MYKMDYKYVSIFSNIGYTLNMFIFQNEEDEKDFVVVSRIGNEEKTYKIRNYFGNELVDDIIDNALEALFRETSSLRSVDIGTYSFSVDEYPTKKICFTLEPTGEPYYIEVERTIVTPEDLVCTAIEMVYSETSPYSICFGPNGVSYKHPEHDID